MENQKIEKISIYDFYGFCRKEIFLIFLVVLATFLSYGVRLIYNDFGLDTERWLARDKIETWKHWLGIGRFFLVFIQYFFTSKPNFNIFLLNWIGFIFLCVTPILWCYILTYLSNNRIKKTGLVIFSLIFVTQPIFTELFCFTLQVAEDCFAYAICPILVYLSFYGILQNKKKIVLSIILLVSFMIGIYQAFILYFVCGVLLSFIIYVFCNESLEKKLLYRLCFKLISMIFLSVFIYFMINESVIKIFSITPESESLLNNANKTSSSFPFYFWIFAAFYQVTLGKLSIVQKFMIPYIAKNASGGMYTAIDFHRGTNVGSAIFIPLFVLFVIMLVVQVRNNKFSILVIFAAFGSVISTFFFAFMGVTSVRTYWAFPLLLAFMYLFIFQYIKLHFSKYLVMVAIIAIFMQIATCSHAFYSDHLRYEQDVALAEGINERLSRIPETKNRPILLIGEYNFSYPHVFSHHRTLGDSIFNAATDDVDVSFKGLSLLSYLGYNYEFTENKDLYLKATEISKTLETYPFENCISIQDDFVLIKLGEAQEN